MALSVISARVTCHCRPSRNIIEYYLTSVSLIDNTLYLSTTKISAQTVFNRNCFIPKCTGNATQLLCSRFCSGGIIQYRCSELKWHRLLPLMSQRYNDITEVSYIVSASFPRCLTTLFRYTKALYVWLCLRIGTQ